MPKIRLRKFALYLVGGLACALMIAALYFYVGTRMPLDNLGTQSPVENQVAESLTDHTAEQLIDELQNVKSEGTGTHSTAWASGFLASNEEPKFRGGIIGSAKPDDSPIMRELVRRGVKALPALIDHLTDHRPTHLVIKLPFNGFGGMWQAAEYDSRHADQDKKRQPKNNSREEERTIISDEYQVRVGDLCYVAIGQIVNRRLNAVRYQPSGCIVINSPVETPSLATSVKQDWGGVTAEQHEQSLIEDSKSPSEYIAAGAKVRLRFYYPEAAARID